MLCVLPALSVAQDKPADYLWCNRARNRGPLFYRSLLHDKEQEVTATQVDTIDIGGKPLQVKIRTPR